MESFALIAQADIGFEFLVYPRHLPYVAKVLERVPNLRAVIDHLAKPEIRAHRLQPWQEFMREVALHPNVCCKLSGMVTEADYQGWNLAHLRPYAGHVMLLFGAERVMFGSDWPVCLLAASYEQVWSVTRALVTECLGTEAEEAVFGRNAAGSGDDASASAARSECGVGASCGNKLNWRSSSQKSFAMFMLRSTF